MSIIPRFLVSVLLLPGVAFGQETLPVGSTDISQLLFVARERGGDSAPSLKPEDVTIIDNGTSAKVLGIEQADKIPVRLGIILFSDGTSFKAQQEAAIRLISTLRPRTDQAFVVTEAGRNPNSVFSKQQGPSAWPNQQLMWDSDPQALISFVRGLRWNMAVPGTSQIAQQMLSLNPDKLFRTILIEFRNPAAESMIEWGFAPFKELDAAQLNEIAAYQRRNAAVYAFAIPSSFYVPHPAETMRAAYLAYRAGESRIERLATSTGGRYFPSAKDFKSEVAEIQRDLQSQFVVRFVPQPSTNRGTPHKIEVRVNRKDVQVACQKLFYPPSP